MALVATITSRWKEGKFTRVKGTLNFNLNYVTSGLDYTGELGKKVLELDIKPFAGFVFEPVYSTQKIKVYYGDYSASTDGPMSEMAQSTLAAVSAAPFTALIQG
jgi:hypothetical protein